MTEPAKKSYGQILKSSALIGSSSVINLGLGIVRTKAMALLLGPSGVGLLGLYGSIADLTRTVAGMGINSSGVRQIAEAVGTGDDHCIARTVTALRRVAFCTGALGFLLLLVLCKPVSRLTFGDDLHAGSVALLALVAFFGDISAGQAALVQGMRRIADLARMNVLGALYGTLFSIPIVYFFYQRGVPERGVVPSLVCVAAMGILTSWWYARKIRVERVSISFRQVAGEASELLKLGFIFMASGLMTVGMAYLVRIIVLRDIGVEAAGFYQAAWALSGIYVSFILQAMGADFYPRLTAAAKDNKECNRLVNEQAEVSLLMAGPGILGALTFAPLVIHLFYSSRFEPAVEIFRWNCLGMLLQVASWPLGFVVLAKGERNIFFWTELAGASFYIGMVWLFVGTKGLVGTGMAFFALYAAHTVAIYVIVRRLSGFRWSRASRQLALVLAPLVAVVFISGSVLPPVVAVILGSAITLPVGIYSLRTLCRLIPRERLPRVVQRLLGFFRLVPSNPYV